MDRNDRRLFVQIVGQILIGDGVLTDAEREYLDELMSRLGMEGSERAEALTEISVDSPVEDRVQALSADARTLLIAEVERAAAVETSEPSSGHALVGRVRSLLGG
jgi:DNA-binding NarL/FixJ family response regulator